MSTDTLRPMSSLRLYLREYARVGVSCHNKGAVTASSGCHARVGLMHAFGCRVTAKALRPRLARQRHVQEKRRGDVTPHVALGGRLLASFWVVMGGDITAIAISTPAGILLT